MMPKVYERLMSIFLSIYCSIILSNLSFSYCVIQFVLSNQDNSGVEVERQIRNRKVVGSIHTTICTLLLCPLESSGLRKGSTTGKFHDIVEIRY
jgi:hypothetical protein